jgi:REP element-mobilizing transposase RayT
LELRVWLFAVNAKPQAVIEESNMGNPIVIAYHLIWTAYGWWLPNDPRGSGSHTIRNDILTELGELHFGRKTVQPMGKTIRECYEKAADLLKHPLLRFDDLDQQLIAQAFAEIIDRQRYTCYACAIMPDHVHLVIRKHKDSAECMADKLKEESRNRLIKADRRAPTHAVWIVGHGWKVFLDHPDEVRHTIRYVEHNPLKIGLPSQSWAFITLYDGWPLHPGHSPNSPYAQRLRAAGRY